MNEETFANLSAEVEEITVDISDDIGLNLRFTYFDKTRTPLVVLGDDPAFDLILSKVFTSADFPPERLNMISMRGKSLPTRPKMLVRHYPKVTDWFGAESTSPYDPGNLEKLDEQFKSWSHRMMKGHSVFSPSLAHMSFSLAYELISPTRIRVGITLVSPEDGNVFVKRIATRNLRNLFHVAPVTQNKHFIQAHALSVNRKYQLRNIERQYDTEFFPYGVVDLTFAEVRRLMWGDDKVWMEQTVNSSPITSLALSRSIREQLCEIVTPNDFTSFNNDGLFMIAWAMTTTLTRPGLRVAYGKFDCPYYLNNKVSEYFKNR